MKYMNNHYGQSAIFGKARFVTVPDKVDPDSGVEFDSAGGGGTEPGESTDPAEDVESLKAQLAKAKADNARLKSQSDNNAREAKKYKDQVRANLSAEQQAQAAQAEKDAEFEALKAEVRVAKYSKRLVSMGMSDEEADEMAQVVPDMEDADAFFDRLASFVASLTKSAGDMAVQKLLKERPDIKAGSGSGEKNAAVDKAVEIAKRRNARRSENNKAADYYRI